MAPKRHMRKAGNFRHFRAACGLLNPVRSTDDPAQVTCLSCRGSLYMADAEFQLTNPGQQRKRGPNSRKGTSSDD